MIFGLDCSSTRTGWGVLDLTGQRISSGVVQPRASLPFWERLVEMAHYLGGIATTYKPLVVAVEAPVMVSKFKGSSTLQVAQAMGVCTVAVLQRAYDGARVFQYQPSTLKKQVTGNGRAEKKDMVEHIGRIYRLPLLDLTDDEADALAAALTHYRKEIAK